MQVVKDIVDNDLQLGLVPNKQIKQVSNNGCIGYNIRGVFKSLHSLRNQIIKIKQKEKLPF